MSNVYFEPWVGCQYSEGINGKRIMVLGHVHVCDGCDNCGVEKCDDFSTQKVVEDYIVWRKKEQYHLQDMKNGFRLTSTLSKLSSDFNQNLKLKKQTFGTRSCFTTIFSWPFPLQLPKLLMMLMSELKSLLYLL